MSGLAGAYALRFNLTLPPDYTDDVAATLVWVVPLQALIFWRFGLYRGLWRFASLPDLQRIVRAVAIAALAVPGALLLLRVDAVLPRSVLLLDPALLLLFMGVADSPTAPGRITAWGWRRRTRCRCWCLAPAQPPTCCCASCRA